MLGVLLTLPLLAAVSADFSDDFVPYYNNLTLNLGLSPTAKSPITGSINLCFKVQRDTSTFDINWGELLTPAQPTVSDLKVTKQPDLKPETVPTMVSVSLVTLNTVRAMLTVTCSTTDGTSPFSSGHYVNVSIAFSTISGRNLIWHEYVNRDNTSSWVMVTDLKKQRARNLFPCWDQPQYPVGMSLIVVRPLLWPAACSMPTTSLKEDVDNKLAHETFSTSTPFPPSDLSLLLASDMTKTDYSMSLFSKAKMHFWTAKDTNASIHSGNIPTLATLYYNVEAQLPAAAPKDIHVALVPNFPTTIAAKGLILTREEDYTGSVSTAQTEGLYTATVLPVLHAFIWQFIPSPATLADSWIQTAIIDFLTYHLLAMGVLGSDKTWTGEWAANLLLKACLKSLGLDDGHSSSPLMSTAINSLSVEGAEATLADPLKVNKGGVILAMLNEVFGGKYAVILNVIRNIINKQTSVSTSSLSAEIISVVSSMGQYSPEEQTAALQQVSKWFETRGYALVNVSDPVIGDPGSVQLTMVPFNRELPLPDELYVAITLATRSEPRDPTLRQNIWINSETSKPTTAFITLKESDWLVANQGSKGYYRATYTERDWVRIQDGLARSTREIPNCARLIDDAFALSRKGLSSFDNALKLAKAALRNPQYTCLSSASRGINGVRDLLWGHSDQYAAYKDFAADYLTTVATQLNNGTFTDSREAARVLSLFSLDFCDHNIDDFPNKASSKLTTLLDGKLPTTVPSSTYDAMVCCGAAHSTSLSPQTLWLTISAVTSTYYMRHYAAVALGCHPKYSEVSSLFSTILAADVQLVPHVDTIFQLIAERHPAELFNNITFFSTKIQSVIGAGGLVNLIRTAATKINTNEQASVINGLKSSTTVDDVVKTAAVITIAAVNTRVQWLQTYNTSLVQDLRTNSPARSSATNTNAVALYSLITVLLIIPISPLRAIYSL